MDRTETLPSDAQRSLPPETENASNAEASNPTPGNPKGGPRTAEGKARSALNNFRHGLAGAFRVAAHESQEEFESLVEALREEHQPATATEDILIRRMAGHYWQGRRAEQLQDPATLADNPSKFALMMRYQAMHDRSFHKCLAELRKLIKERLEQASDKQKEFQEQLSAALREFEWPEVVTDIEKTRSGLISALRVCLGKLCPDSDEALLSIFRRSLMHCFEKLDKTAAAKEPAPTPGVKK